MRRSEKEDPSHDFVKTDFRLLDGAMPPGPFSEKFSKRIELDFRRLLFRIGNVL